MSLDVTQTFQTRAELLKTGDQTTTTSEMNSPKNPFLSVESSLSLPDSFMPPSFDSAMAQLSLSSIDPTFFSNQIMFPNEPTSLMEQSSLAGSMQSGLMEQSVMQPMLLEQQPSLQPSLLEQPNPLLEQHSQLLEQTNPEFFQNSQHDFKNELHKDILNPIDLQNNNSFRLAQEQDLLSGNFHQIDFLQQELNSSENNFLQQDLQNSFHNRRFSSVTQRHSPLLAQAALAPSAGDARITKTRPRSKSHNAHRPSQDALQFDLLGYTPPPLVQSNPSSPFTLAEIPELTDSMHFDPYAHAASQPLNGQPRMNRQHRSISAASSISSVSSINSIPESEGPWTCPCPMPFTDYDAYQFHIKSKHSNKNEDKPNVCEHCGRGFTRRQDLKRHKLTHFQSFKPFLCGKCGTTFTRNDALHRHVKARRCG